MSGDLQRHPVKAGLDAARQRRLHMRTPRALNLDVVLMRSSTHGRSNTARFLNSSPDIRQASLIMICLSVRRRFIADLISSTIPRRSGSCAEAYAQAAVAAQSACDCVGGTSEVTFSAHLAEAKRLGDCLMDEVQSPPGPTLVQTT
jgi:hypothetical protein